MRSVQGDFRNRIRYLFYSQEAEWEYSARLTEPKANLVCGCVGGGHLAVSRQRIFEEFFALPR